MQRCHFPSSQSGWALVLYSVVKVKLRQLRRTQNLIVWTKVGDEKRIEGLPPFLFVKLVEFPVAQAAGKFDGLIRQNICNKM